MSIPTEEDVRQARLVLQAAGMDVETPTQRTLEVQAVSLKLPALWPDNPEKWFLHCEAKFRLHKIVVQQTMFDHCVHAMTAEQSDVIMDLMVKTPSSSNCYDELRRIYLQRRTPSTAERVQRLRALGPLGDQRPSDLLRLMERILGRTVQGDEIATEEFITRLPERIQLMVHAQAESFSVEQMATMADRLIGVPVTQHTFSVENASTSADSTLHQQVASLTASNERMLAEMSLMRRNQRVQPPRQQQTSRTGNQDRRRPPKMYRGLNAEDICWYHAAWGAEAHKCVDGCRYAGNGRAGR